MMSSSRLLPLVLLCGCGYTFGTGFAEVGIRTVSVQVVDNETFRHRLEVPLTRQINAELINLTDLVPASRSTADAVLTVEITDAFERTLVTGNRTIPVEEGALVMLVRTRLVAQGSGQVLSDRESLRQTEFRVPIGETLETATQEMIQDMARQIVLALETAF